MKTVIGVISDTHLRKVTKEFQELYHRYLSDVDALLHAGDFVSREMVSFLLNKNFHGVCGNMDPPEVRKMLPGTATGYAADGIHSIGRLTIDDKIRGEIINID